MFFVMGGNDPGRGAIIPSSFIDLGVCGGGAGIAALVDDCIK